MTTSVGINDKCTTSSYQSDDNYSAIVSVAYRLVNQGSCLKDNN